MGNVSDYLRNRLQDGRIGRLDEVDRRPDS